MLNIEREKLFWLTISRVEKTLKYMYQEDSKEVIIARLECAIKQYREVPEECPEASTCSTWN